jgi:hypothetical protein
MKHPVRFLYCFKVRTIELIESLACVSLTDWKVCQSQWADLPLRLYGQPYRSENPKIPSPLPKRYGFPICRAVHTIPMVNHPVKNDKPPYRWVILKSDTQPTDCTNSWDWDCRLASTSESSSFSPLRSHNLHSWKSVGEPMPKLLYPPLLSVPLPCEFCCYGPLAVRQWWVSPSRMTYLLRRISWFATVSRCNRGSTAGSVSIDWWIDVFVAVDRCWCRLSRCCCRSTALSIAVDLLARCPLVVGKFEMPKFGISLLVQFLHGIYGEPTVGAK